MGMLFATLAVLMAVRASSYPASEPAPETSSEHDDRLLSLVDDFIADDVCRATSWDPYEEWQHSLQLKYDHLVEVINTSGSHRDVIERLLHWAGKSRKSSKRYGVLVWRLWATFPTSLANERDLLLRLLSHTSPKKSQNAFPFLQVVIESFSPSGLSSTANDPCSVLEHVIDRKRDRSLNRFDMEILELLRKNSLDDDVERARIRSAHCLPPSVWVRVFHENVDLSVAEPDQIEATLESLLADIPEHDFLKSALIVRCASPRERALRIFAAIDVREIIENLGRLLSSGSVGEEQLDAIAYLFEHCVNFEDLQELVLDQIPSMFKTLRQAVEFLQALKTGGIFRDSEPLWSKFMCKLLSLLLNSRPDLIVTALDLDSLLSIASVMSSFDREIPYFIDSEEAITIALDIYNQYPASDDHPADVPSTLDKLRPFFIPLIFWRMVECDISEDWLVQIQDVSDAELRFACALASTRSDSFQRFMNDLRPINIALFNRISHLVPDHVVTKPAPDIKFYPPLMDVRNVTNISDDYEILNRLGSGGFGTVFRARCLRGMSNMEVAIKVVRSEERSTADEIEFMSKFCVGDQRLPGLVQLLDMFRCGDKTYLVMELVHGRCLAYWPVPQTPDEAALKLIEIVYQMFAIFGQISSCGYSHRDVFFRNVMMDTVSNRLVVVDFGESWCAPDLDFGAVLDRVRDLLVRIHSRLDLIWYERSPGLLGEFEQALNRWIIEPRKFRGVLDDAIFDRVRDQFQPSRSQKYDEFPEMSRSRSNHHLMPAAQDSDPRPPPLQTVQDRGSLPVLSQSGADNCSGAPASTSDRDQRPSPSLAFNPPLSSNGTQRHVDPDLQSGSIPPSKTSLPPFLPPESSLQRSPPASDSQQVVSSSILHLNRRHDVLPLLAENDCRRCPEPTVKVDSTVQGGSVGSSHEPVGHYLCDGRGDRIESSSDHDTLESVRHHSDQDPALQSSLNSDARDAAVSKDSDPGDSGSCSTLSHARVKSSSIHRFWICFLVVAAVVTTAVFVFAVVARKRHRTITITNDGTLL